MSCKKIDRYQQGHGHRSHIMRIYCFCHLNCWSFYNQTLVAHLHKLEYFVKRLHCCVQVTVKAHNVIFFWMVCSEQMNLLYPIFLSQGHGDSSKVHWVFVWMTGWQDIKHQVWMISSEQFNLPWAKVWWEKMFCYLHFYCLQNCWSFCNQSQFDVTSP